MTHSFPSPRLLVQTQTILRWLVTAMLLAAGSSARADMAEDRFILGYATATLEQQFKLQIGSLQVKDAIILIHAKDLPAPERDKVVEALKQIKGVLRVNIVDVPDKEPLPTPVRPEKSATVELGETTPKGGEFLPEGRLFEGLIADPRTPHFSVAYQRYSGDPELDTVGAISLGAPIGIYENNFWGAGRWQVGIDAAVFAIFDLEAPSTDLVNADYWLGFPFSYRYKDFSTMLRLYHQSSHLGDEFLLRNRADRINVSYEGVDLRVSHDFFKKTARLYAGGGYILRAEPDDLQKGSAQAGLELRSPWAFFVKHFRPVAGLDVQSHEESDWDINWSARAGFQFESEKLRARHLQLLFEYYKGRSPNGQFFAREIEYWGIGLHFYFD
jgi:hypothetical protein